MRLLEQEDETDDGVGDTAGTEVRTMDTTLQSMAHINDTAENLEASQKASDLEIEQAASEARKAIEDRAAAAARAAADALAAAAAAKTSMSKEDQGSSSGSKSAIDMSDLYSKEIEELLQTDSEDELVPAEYRNWTTSG